MNVDKFGHHVFKRTKVNSYIEPYMAFINFNDDFIDVKNKAIKHLGNPIDPADGVTKQYVDNMMEVMFKKITTINQTFEQLDTEIKSLKQSIDSASQRSKYRK